MTTSKVGGLWFTRLAVAGVLACTGSAMGQFSTGADVTLQSPADGYTNWGVTTGVRAYSIGSHTCNMGNQNLLWTGGGTPGLAMNVFRLKNGRLEQIGQGWAKIACCAAQANACNLPSCTPGSGLGAGCRDPYSSGYNGGQSRLTRRSRINAWTGVFGATGGGTGTIGGRCQVAETDMNAALNPGALYFTEGVYVADDETNPVNKLNNATYSRATVTAGTYDLIHTTGSSQMGIPAIRAWRDHGLGVNLPDNSVTVEAWDVAGEGRFWVACKTTDLSGGQWRYEVAVYNLCSDRSGQSFSIPLCPGAIVTNTYFKDVNYEAAEGFNNTDWTTSITGTEIRWSGPTFAADPNGNALRWGTMYNFGFTCNRAPGTGAVTLDLFKPGTPTSIGKSLPIVPQCPQLCPADWNQSGTLDSSDFFDFLEDFLAGSADYNESHSTDSSDFFDFLEDFLASCE